LFGGYERERERERDWWKIIMGGWRRWIDKEEEEEEEDLVVGFWER
jgi:hypothetical protein